MSVHIIYIISMKTLFYFTENWTQGNRLSDEIY